MKPIPMSAAGRTIDLRLSDLRDEMDYRENNGGRGPEVRLTPIGLLCEPCWIRDRERMISRLRFQGWESFTEATHDREDEMVICGNLLRPNGCASEPAVGVHNED